MSAQTAQPRLAVAAAVAFAANLLVVVIYGLVLRRALKDHKQVMPTCHMRCAACP